MMGGISFTGGLLAAVVAAAMIVPPAGQIDELRLSGRLEEARELAESMLAKGPAGGDPAAVAAVWALLGDVRVDEGLPRQALAAYQEALANWTEAGNGAGIADTRVRSAKAHLLLGRVETAQSEVKRALAADLVAGKSAVDLAAHLRALAAVGRHKGDFPMALEAAMQAADADRSAGRKAEVPLDLLEVAQVHEALGDTEKADRLIAETLEKARETRSPGLEAELELRCGTLLADRPQALGVASIHLENAIRVFRGLGWRARARAARALLAQTVVRSGEEGRGLAALDGVVAEAEREGERGETVSLGRLRAALLLELGRPKDAAPLLEVAARQGRESRSGALAATLLEWGIALVRSDEAEHALDVFAEAAAEATSLGDPDLQADARAAMGDALVRMGKAGNATAAFERSVSLDKQSGPDAQARRLDAAGISLLAGGFPSQAAAFFTRAVDLKEVIRKRAAPDQRRRYLSSQIRTYNHLIGARLRSGDLGGAFEAFERSRARWLAETLADRQERAPVASLGQLQGLLGPDTVAILFIDAEPLGLWALVVDRSKAFAVNVEDARVRAVADRVAPVGGKARIAPAPALARLVRRYLRALRGEESGKVARDLSRELYGLLLSPAAERLGAARKVLVVPDGVLNLVPFEALEGPDGKPLVSALDVRYSHSISVLARLQDRASGRAKRPLLGIGNPEYGPATPSAALVPLAGDALLENLYANLDRGGAQLESYRQLGLDRWKPLPGSEKEIAAICTRVPGAGRLTGADITEAGLRALSAAGDLEKYRILHFAMHGVAVPEIPELSALVLSQPSRDPGDDNFLRVEEAARLAIKADTVVLSACETGIGKLLGGEGVVGLAQSFIAAGANGVVVSHWAVSDDATRILMEATYESYLKGDVTFYQALAAAKRRFIEGEFGARFKHPYFWAPFIYFGG